MIGVPWFPVCTPLVAAVSGMELARIGHGGSLVVAEQRGTWQTFGGWTIYDNWWVRLILVAVEDSNEK